MSSFSKALLLVAGLGLAACSNNDGLFGNDASGLGGTGTGSFEPGSADDPRSVAYFQQTVGDRILFPVDQSSVSDEARPTLQAQANWLLENTDYVAVIEGHADEQGTREYNLALGARRASAVKEFLVSRGIAPNRLKTVSYGKERPLEICSAEACYAQNRRAVTVLTADLSS